MIACVFAACSNEDDPIPSVDPTPTPEAGTADLTIVVKNLTKSTQTKAGEDENAKEGEAKIYNLFVALYNEDGTSYKVNGTDILRHNPVMLINEEDWVAKKYQLSGVFSVDVTPFKGFKYTPTVSVYGILDNTSKKLSNKKTRVSAM